MRGFGIALGAAANSALKTNQMLEEADYLKQEREYKAEQRQKERDLDEKLKAIPQVQNPTNVENLDEIGMMGKYGLPMEAAQQYTAAVREGKVDANQLIQGLHAQSGAEGKVYGMRGADGSLGVSTEVPKARPFADIARDQALVLLQHGGRDAIPQAVGMLEKTYSLHRQELERQVGDAMRAPTEADRIKALGGVWSETSHIPGKVEYQMDPKTGAVTVLARDGDQVTLPPQTFAPVRNPDGTVMSPSQQMYEKLLGSFSFDNYVKLGTLGVQRKEAADKGRYYNANADYLDRSAGRGTGNGSNGGYKGRPVTLHKNDEGGFIAVDATSGAPVYNLSGSGAILPLGMSSNQFTTLQKQAGDVGVEVASGMDANGRVVVGYRGPDGKTYTSLDEARRARPASNKPAGEAPETPAAPKKGGLPSLSPQAEKIGAELDSTRQELRSLGAGPGLRQQKADPQALPNFLKRKAQLESRVKELDTQYQEALPEGTNRVFSR